VQQYDADGKLKRHLLSGTQCSNIVLTPALIVGCGDKLAKLPIETVLRTPVRMHGECNALTDVFWQDTRACTTRPTSLRATTQAPTSSPMEGMATSIVLFALGVMLRAAGLMEPVHAQGTCKFLVNAAVPSLLLLTFWNMHAPDTATLLAVFSTIFGFAFVFGLGPATLIFAGVEPERYGLLLILSMGWNIGLFGFPIIRLLFGDHAEFLWMALFDIPNVAVNFGLSYAIMLTLAPTPENSCGYVPLTDSLAPRPRRSWAKQLFQLSSKEKSVIARRIAVFPPLLFSILGCTLNASGISSEDIPISVSTAITSIGSTCSPVALIVMGVYTDFNDLPDREQLNLLGKVMALRYVPTVCAVLSTAIFAPDMLREPSVRALSVGLLMPQPLIAIPYAAEWGYDVKLASSSVVLSTLVAFVLVGGYLQILEFSGVLGA